MAGLARFRYGGNIPLIGLITHGFVLGNENLSVERDTINYGYASRDPAKYTESAPVRDQSLLDQNHSHFILVSRNALKCCSRHGKRP